MSPPTKSISLALLAAIAIPLSAQQQPTPPVKKILACAEGAHAELSPEGTLLCESVDEKGAPIRPTPPELLSSVDPLYPDNARDRNIQGECYVSLTVGTDGKPQNVRIVKSLSPELDAAALEAVQLYRFKPATRNGQPVPAKIAVQLSFHPASR